MGRLVEAVLAAILVSVAAQSKLQTRFTWNQVDWEFPDEKTKEDLVASGDYQPQNGLPVGIERWQNKLFVSVPRWKKGVPATLNYINLDESTGVRHNVPLKPYRGFERNRAGDCENGLNTVYRIKADRCDRLWVLDVGTTGIGGETRQECPYSINVFDLKTDERIARYQFRPEDTNRNTFIANTLVDVGETCDDAHAYFSDELGYGLVVYSLQKNESWRFEHPFFFPDPLRGDFNIGGLNFQWADEGIFGLALGPRNPDGSKTVYFSPLASFREFTVSNRVLQNREAVEDSFREFKALAERGEEGGHTTARVVDEKTGIMLYNLIDENAVGCWNTATSYKPGNLGLIDQDNTTLIFPADVKIDHDDNVWVISDRMPNFLIRSVDPADVNYHIFSAPLKSLVEGTRCVETQDVEDRFAAPEVQKPTLVDILSPVAADSEVANREREPEKKEEKRPEEKRPEEKRPEEKKPEEKPVKEEIYTGPPSIGQVANHQYGQYGSPFGHWHHHHDHHDHDQEHKHGYGGYGFHRHW